jgi:hypothetical protein
MTRRENKNETSLKKVVITYIEVPDADQRLARSIDLLLQAADSHVSPNEKKASENSPKTNSSNSKEVRK